MMVPATVLGLRTPIRGHWVMVPALPRIGDTHHTRNVEDYIIVVFQFVFSMHALFRWDGVIPLHSQTSVEIDFQFTISH